MAVDVVVVNYHTDDLLADFVQSYRENYWDGCCLTIVDVDPLAPNQRLLYDDSIPGTASYFPTVGNVGYGAACNAGGEHGTNDVILLANADTLLTDGFKECHDQLMGHDDWGILGPRQINEQRFITAGGIMPLGRGNQQRGWNEIDRGQYSDVLECPFVSGSLLFVKRKLWQEMTKCLYFREAQPDSVGAALETPHYYEDTWLGYHSTAHGYKNIYYGPVQMTHLWHRSSQRGGWADNQFATSQQMYRRACQLHGIQGE